MIFFKIFVLIHIYLFHIYIFSPFFKVSVLGITLIFQPMAPILTPLTAIGLLCRYWSEKFMMVNGAMTVPGPRCVVINLGGF